MRIHRPVTVGEALPPRRIGPIATADIIRFAGAGGDFNPLHHDPAAAAAAGFDAVIAMGQLQAGMLGSWVSDLFGIEYLQQLSVKFTAPVRVGDTLEFVGTVTAIRENLADLDLTVRAGDVTVISGSAVVRVSESRD